VPQGQRPGKHAARHRAERATRSLNLPIPARAAAVAAPLATVAVVGVGVAATGGSLAAGSGTGADLGRAAGAATKVSATKVSASAVTSASRSLSISRSLDRTGSDWATADLNVYGSPKDDATRFGELKSGSKVTTTGVTNGDFTEVLVNGSTRWVHTSYLSDKKPVDPASIGLVFKPCAASASVEHGLTSSMIRVWEVVCNAFPEVKEYGGFANRPEHNTGRALDVMVYGDSALGYKIAEFIQAHASELNIYDIIYRQHIWTPVRSSEGWRLMPNRGSATANHMDHVHIGVN
jgi:hypothetical protein